MPLSDIENCAVGVICGVSDTTLLQSANYWKNAQQQKLPFTLDPFKLYRGYTANTLQNGFCVMSQFFFNGAVKNALTGGSDRPLGNGEKIFAGVAAGALSSILANPLEFVMIQQQLKGDGLVATMRSLLVDGPQGALTITRGTLGMMLREGIYCGGYLGIMPVVREEVVRRYPHSWGSTDDKARLCATIVAGPFCSFSSHPPDTVKTVLQGDMEGRAYTGYMQATRKIVAERGAAALWSGLPWRLFRQFVAVFLFDKIHADLAPKLFPHAFQR